MNKSFPMSYPLFFQRWVFFAEAKAWAEQNGAEISPFMRLYWWEESGFYFHTSISEEGWNKIHPTMRQKKLDEEIFSLIKMVAHGDAIFKIKRGKIREEGYGKFFKKRLDEFIVGS